MTKGEHQGAEVYAQPGGDGVVAVDDEALVFSDTQKQVFDALDAHAAGGDQTLPGTDRFTDALGEAPARRLRPGLPRPRRVRPAAPPRRPARRPSSSASPTTSDAVMAASHRGGARGRAPEGRRARRADVDRARRVQPARSTTTVPADALAYVGFYDLAGSSRPSLPAGPGRLRRRGAPAAARGACPGQLPQLLGVSLDDLSALTAGEHALVVTAGARRPGAALALQVEDGAQAQATLDKLRVGVPALAEDVQPRHHAPAVDSRCRSPAGVQGWRLPLSPEAGVVYGVDGDLAIVGTSVPAVTSVQRPVAPLSASAAYQQGISRDARAGHLGPLDQPRGRHRRPAQRAARFDDATPRRSPTCAR